MNQYKKTYLIIWCLMTALFNAAVFLSPAGQLALELSLPAFWVGYGCIMAALIIQLVCFLAVVARAGTAEQVFLRIPLLRLSNGCVVLSALLGGGCIALPFLPNWLTIVVAAAVLVFYIIAMLNASAAGDIVAQRHRQVADKTALLYSLRDSVHALSARAKDEADRAACEKLYDALRYSDPMTSDVVAIYDARLGDKCAQLREAVLHGGNVSMLVEEALLLLEERNLKCRMSK